MHAEGFGLTKGHPLQVSRCNFGFNPLSPSFPYATTVLKYINGMWPPSLHIRKHYSISIDYGPHKSG